MRFGFRITTVATSLAVLLAHAAFAGHSNSLMDISSDGRFLACSNRDSGSVTIIDLSDHEAPRVTGEIAVGAEPEGVSFLGASHALAVAVYADDRIAFLDAESRESLGSVDVFDEPYGVVASDDGARVWVTLEYPGQVVEIDARERRVLRSFDAGNFPRGIALAPDGTRLFATEYLTARVLAIDIESGEVVDRWKGASTDNLARQIVLHPKRAKAYVPHIRSRVSAAHGEGSVFPYVNVVDTASGEGRRRKRIPMDAFRGNFVVANPWEIALSPDGRRLWVVFSGTDDLFACEVLDDDYKEIRYRDRLRLGHNPRALRVSPDGKTLWVYNALDFDVVAYDTERLREIARVQVCENPLGEEILKGKRLFYSALQPMVGRRWISCSSCHPDGDADGRTWSNPEGQRNTPALFGMAWTHPLHWSADRDETQDFEHTIRGPLMQGRGLVRGKVNPPLGEPNKGLSPDLDALSAYTSSHRFRLSPHAKNGLSDTAKRGKAVFSSSKAHCATCHDGPFYTDSVPGSPRRRHDVGTGGDDPTEIMGPAYDTPTLLGVYRTAPYLHHGKAATLEEVLVKYNAGDRHGVTSHLNASQIADLVEFLRALPFENPEAAARAAGMTRVVR